VIVSGERPSVLQSPGFLFSEAVRSADFRDINLVNDMVVRRSLVGRAPENVIEVLPRREGNCECTRCATSVRYEKFALGCKGPGGTPCAFGNVKFLRASSACGRKRISVEPPCGCHSAQPHGRQRHSETAGGEDLCPR